LKVQRGGTEEERTGMVNQWHQCQVWHRLRFRLLLYGGSHSGEDCSGLIACFACSSFRKMVDVRFSGSQLTFSRLQGVKSQSS
jgi:hypothetical protein